MILLASAPGFENKTAAERYGEEQEALIRKGTWIDPQVSEVPFGEFAEQWMSVSRLAINTRAKYRSQLDNHVLPQWEDWPLVALLDAYMEIQGWVNELHEELKESTVASVFALFSTILNAAVRARKVPFSPCQGIKVTSGEQVVERLVATPLQFLRVALRMEGLMGYSGFVLTLLDGYTGARWSELISQKPNQYDKDLKRFPVRRPIREARGKIEEAPRPKTPTGRRWIQLPPFLAQVYEPLVIDCPYERVFTGERGGVLRNFARRFWRPAWDGDPAARPGHKQPGMADAVAVGRR
ncbi:hypothetical protein SMC26_22965 [Actinomadura fulvescens]|uniref:Core-binding (CB) domain-containing protein n=1 Tax=Actinomadura fulvescens TaxID=46160 RepID=A0ABN3QYI9_9ACTN